MKPSILVFRTSCMAFLIFPWLAMAKPVDAISLREVDRSLNLPKGVAQEQLIWSVATYSPDSTLKTEEQSNQGYFPSLPNFSLTDRLEWLGCPAPLFQYLLLGSPRALDSTSVGREFQLAIGGGLSAIAYSQRDGWQILSDAFLRAKIPWTRRFWGLADAGLRIENRHLYSTSLAAGLGIQWSNRLYSISKYQYVQFLVLDWPYYQDWSQEVGVHFNSMLSLSFTGHWIQNPHANTTQLGSVISFQW